LEKVKIVEGLARLLEGQIVSFEKPLFFGARSNVTYGDQPLPAIASAIIGASADALSTTITRIEMPGEDLSASNDRRPGSSAGGSNARGNNSVGVRNSSNF
jgi:hypothetical protein